MNVSCYISAHMPVFAICGLVGRFSCVCRRGVGSGAETFPCTIKATHLSSETTVDISPVGKIFLPYWECDFRMLSCHMAKVREPRQLSLAGTALGHQIAHHAAHFLPFSVGTHEFGSTCVRFQEREKFWNDRLMYVFCRFREKKRQIFRASARIWHAWRGDLLMLYFFSVCLSYSLM